MTSPHNLSETVLATIKDQKVTMRPHWHYVLQGVLGLMGIAVLTLFLVFIVSFIFFVLNQSGALIAPEFGLPGVQAALVSLPWLLILLSLLFIVALELLAKRYTLLYRRPLVYSVFGIMIIATVGGLVIAQTPLHRGLFNRADQVPFAGPMYRGLGAPQAPHIYPGRIRALTDHGFYLETPRREQLLIVVTPDTRFLHDATVDADDFVVVFGERTATTVAAHVIRKFTPSEGHPIVPRLDRE